MDWFCAAPALLVGGWQRTTASLNRRLWLLIGLLLLMAGPTRAEVLVTDVSFAARSDGLGYVMRIQTTDRPEAYLLDPSVGEHQLKLVLFNAELHEEYQKRAPEGPVKRYTASHRKSNLVIRLHLTGERSVAAKAYRDGASDDLLLNLAYEDAAPVAGDSPTDSDPASAGATEEQDPISKVARENSRLDTVVVDPGHGGRDPGAVAHGLQEKDVVLEVAHKLGDYIENRLDIEVIYTRTGDQFVPLEERGHFANRVGGDLFISLHANAAPAAPSARGTETYFLGRAKTDAARQVMRRENSVVRQYEENPDRYDEYDEEAFVKGELFLSASMRFSETFASLVQNQFKHRVQRRSRGVHQAGFYVLWSASMPSVLVELGFLTNPREARFLNSDRGQTYLASAIFRAVRDYEDEYNKGIVASE